MLFRHVAVNQGRSQREVAEAIGLPQPHRAIVDGLEAKGWIRRRPSGTDRRTKALHLTRKGQAALTRIMAISASMRPSLRGPWSLPTNRADRLLNEVALDRV